MVWEGERRWFAGLVWERGGLRGLVWEVGFGQRREAGRGGRGEGGEDGEKKKEREICTLVLLRFPCFAE